MKSSRLISIIMLLQSHQQITAKRLAEKLEVSIRTIYRDIETLSHMGVPLFTEKGPNGGVRLLEQYHTDLGKLNPDESLCLFVPVGDQILNDLGIKNMNATLLYKLFSNSSPQLLEQIQMMQDYVYIDMEPWQMFASDTSSVLEIVQKAIWQKLKLSLTYHKPNEKKQVIVHPLGIVCKKGVWYLIAENALMIKTYKVSSIENPQLLKTHFVRPHHFNLQKHWKASIKDFKKQIPRYNFIYKIHPNVLNQIKQQRNIDIIRTFYDHDDLFIEIVFNDIQYGIAFAFMYTPYLLIISPKEAIHALKTKAQHIKTLYA